MNDNYSEERRDFLKTLAVLGGAAATLATVKKTTAATPKLLSPPGATTSGYRETEHIKKYYQTARN